MTAAEQSTRAQQVTALPGARPSLFAGLCFTIYANVDLQMVLAMVPVAVLHGTRVRPEVFSFVLSVHVAAALVGTVLTPILLGRTHPGRILALSSVLRATGFAALVLSFSAPALYAFAVCTGLGLGVSRPAVRTLLNGAAGERNRAKVFQLFFILLNAALVLAPVIADVARPQAVAALAVLTVVEIICGSLVLTASRKLPLESPRSEGGRWTGWLRLLRHGHIRATLGYTFVCYFAMGFMLATFLLYNVVTPNLAGYRTLLLSFEPLALIAIQLVLIPLFSRLGRRRRYAIAALTGGPGMVLAFTPVLWLVMVGLVLFALAESVAMPNIQLEAADGVPAGRAAVVFSLVTVATAIGEIVGNLAAGLVVQHPASWLPSPAGMGMTVGVLFLIGLLAGGFAIVRHSGQPTEES